MEVVTQNYKIAYTIYVQQIQRRGYILTDLLEKEYTILNQ